MALAPTAPACRQDFGVWLSIRSSKKSNVYVHSFFRRSLPAPTVAFANCALLANSLFVDFDAADANDDYLCMTFDQPLSNFAGTSAACIVTLKSSISNINDNLISFTACNVTLNGNDVVDLRLIKDETALAANDITWSNPNKKCSDLVLFGTTKTLTSAATTGAACSGNK